MNILKGIKSFISKYVFSVKWRCINCGKEIFEQGYFCDDCKKSLPLNEGCICERCGRKAIQTQPVCTTCKQNMQYLDFARSSFSYEKPITALIHRLKFSGRKFYAEPLADYMSVTYYKNLFSSDFITYVPMTEKAERKRGYNQSELLAKALSERVNVQVNGCVVKIKETEKQLKLGREERLKNLKGVFRVHDRRSVKDKNVLIVDDVFTTGATAEVMAKALKGAGAKTVSLLTVASVPPTDGY